MANWYSRLPPWCIHSWQQLKKVLAQLPRVPGGAQHGGRFSFLCSERERDTPNFYRRFLQLKAQALEVSDDHVITQAFKALHAGPLHSHLVREWPKTVSKLYDQFAKFGKSDIEHFHKLE
jgi:hypothetical protein